MGKSIEKAYLGGPNTNPLQHCYRGSTAYTDKLENSFPGPRHKLYRYRGKSVGNQLYYTNLARSMNYKAALDDDKPATKFNEKISGGGLKNRVAMGNL